MVASPPCWFLGRLSALHWASSNVGVGLPLSLCGLSSLLGRPCNVLP